MMEQTHKSAASLVGFNAIIYPKRKNLGRAAAAGKVGKVEARKLRAKGKKIYWKNRTKNEIKHAQWSQPPPPAFAIGSPRIKSLNYVP